MKAAELRKLLDDLSFPPPDPFRIRDHARSMLDKHLKSLISLMKACEDYAPPSILIELQDVIDIE